MMKTRPYYLTGAAVILTLISLLACADVWFGDTTQRSRVLIETQREDIAFGGLWPRYRVTALDLTNDAPAATHIAFVAWWLDQGVLTNEKPAGIVWILNYIDVNGLSTSETSSGDAISINSDLIKEQEDEGDVRRCHITAICNSLTAEVFLAIITPGTDTDRDWIPDVWERTHLDTDGEAAYDPARDSGNARLEPLADGTNNLVRFILGLGADLAGDAAHGLRIQPAYYPVLLRGNNNSFTASVLHYGVWSDEEVWWQFSMPGYTSPSEFLQNYWPQWNDAIQLGSFGSRQWTTNNINYSLRSARGSVRAWTAGFTNTITMYAAEWSDGGSVSSDDSDYDGMPNTWESLFGTPPFQTNTNDAAMDFDGDGIVNVEEFLRGLSPVATDTDGDGIDDAREVETGLNPLLADTDGDGIPDDWDINPHGPNPAPVIIVESPPPGATI